ncbi:MAG: hypothetical protein U0744_01025 [Gemmataceae bacterium]
MQRCLPAFIIGTCFFALLGCPGSSHAPLPTAKVKGNVKLDGKPMPSGDLRFSIPNQPVKTLEVKDGAFAGEAYVGKNLVEAVLEKDGPPHPMDPKTKLKVNSIGEKFYGPNSTLKAEVVAGENPPFNFEVTSKK